MREGGGESWWVRDRYKERETQRKGGGHREIEKKRVKGAVREPER